MLLQISQRANFFCSGEAHFNLSGILSKRNCRHWAENNPQELYKRLLRSSKVTVLCDLSRFGMIEI